MKAYFYCSYNLSPVGYQKITLDPEAGTQSRGPVEVEPVRTLFTHGGANTAFGYNGSAYYLVLKNMQSVKEDVPRNVPGRNWYMNCALTASPEELADLCAAACYAYTAYQEFSERLAACLTAQEEETSFAIDADAWRALLAEASARYEAFSNSGAADFRDAPCGLGLEQLNDALAILRSRQIEGLYEFVLLEGEASYFLSSCGCKDPSQLRHYAKAGGESAAASDVQPERPGEWGNAAVGLLAGCAVLTLCAVCCFGWKRWKNRRRRLLWNE